MKHIKKYEQNISIEVGDYVICTDNGITNDNNFEVYLKSHIGKIILIKKYIKDPYLVLYENLPDKFKTYSSTNDNLKLIKFNENEIIHFSKNKEDLEHIIVANKYNI